MGNGMPVGMRVDRIMRVCSPAASGERWFAIRDCVQNEVEDAVREAGAALASENIRLEHGIKALDSKLQSTIAARRDERRDASETIQMLGKKCNVLSAEKDKANWDAVNEKLSVAERHFVCESRFHYDEARNARVGGPTMDGPAESARGDAYARAADAVHALMMPMVPPSEKKMPCLACQKGRRHCSDVGKRCEYVDKCFPGVVPQPKSAHALLMRELLEVMERTRVGCGKGPAKTIDQLALTQLAALSEVTDHVAAKLAGVDRTGWERAMKRVAEWLEAKAGMLGEGAEEMVRRLRSDAKFIRFRPYEPPVMAEGTAAEPVGLDVNKAVKEIHATAVAKGWWDDHRQKLVQHMLMVTEIGEASQCVRKGDPPDGADGKPEGEAAELADVVLRVMDYFGKHGWDLAAILRRKMDYNKTRTARHDAETT